MGSRWAWILMYKMHTLVCATICVIASNLHCLCALMRNHKRPTWVKSEIFFYISLQVGKVWKARFLNHAQGAHSSIKLPLQFSHDVWMPKELSHSPRAQCPALRAILCLRGHPIYMYIYLVQDTHQLALMRMLHERLHRVFRWLNYILFGHNWNK